MACRTQVTRNCDRRPLKKKFAELEGSSQTIRRSAAPPQAASQRIHHWQRAEPHGDTQSKEPKDHTNDPRQDTSKTAKNAKDDPHNVEIQSR